VTAPTKAVSAAADWAPSTVAALLSPSSTGVAAMNFRTSRRGTGRCDPHAQRLCTATR
jgi:hypothetical protein